MNRKLFYLTLGIIFLAEIFSFWGNSNQTVREVSFWGITIGLLVLSLIRLEYGIYFLVTELIIGSFGYLFSINPWGINLSVRMAIFMIVVSVGLTRMISSRQLYLWQSRFLKLYLALIFILGLGLVTAWLNGNKPASIFFDFNGWLYLAVAIPIFQVWIDSKRNPDLKVNFFSVILAALIASISKSLFLLYVFSHGFIDPMSWLYRWIRDTRVGEITYVEGNFYRIFFQSQIYSLLGFFLVISYWYSREKILSVNQKRFLNGLLVLMLTSIFLSFSRSFWLGAAVGVMVFCGYLIYQWRFYDVVWWLGRFGVGWLVTLILIFIVVKFPFPKPDVSSSELWGTFEKRLSSTSEAAVASRWLLLGPLSQEIASVPPAGLGWVIGKGFGAEVTYRSQDPTVLKTNPSGVRTTFAFEWGWLDIWLKVGFIGVLVYLFWLGQMFYSAFLRRDYDPLAIGIGISLIVLAVVNIFTPYLNHPLGIFVVVFISAYLSDKTQDRLDQNVL